MEQEVVVVEEEKVKDQDGAETVSVIDLVTDTEEEEEAESGTETGEETEEEEEEDKSESEDSVKRTKRGFSYPLYHYPGTLPVCVCGCVTFAGTPVSIAHVGMTDDGALPIVCIRPRGDGQLSFVMDVFSSVPIRRIRGAYLGRVVRLTFTRVFYSKRCAEDEFAYRLQLTALCRGNRGYSGVRSLMLRFVDGSAKVISFYRVANAGGNRLARCNRPEAPDAVADRKKLMRRAARSSARA